MSKFGQMLGTEQEYFISGANYKSVLNGNMVKEQLYLGAENKLYSVMANKPEPQIIDASNASEEVTGSEVTKSKDKIVGVKCKKLVVQTNKGSTTYWFSPKYAVDPALYQGHKFGGWYYMLSQTKAVPLKIVMETPQFVLTSEAISIEEMDLRKDMFQSSK